MSDQISDRTKSILFAAVLCLVCGTLLTAASAGLKERQQKNFLTDRRENILKSIGLIDTNTPHSPMEIDQLYNDNITLVHTDGEGRIIEESKQGDLKNITALPVYLYMKKDGPIKAYILPIDTNGLWGKILGYLAIESDGSTIMGFTVYKHSETPGLGGEIEQNWFQRNFVGKKMIDLEGMFVSVSVAKGKVTENIPKESRMNFVDGISGATITGKLLTGGLKNILMAYEPVSVKLRNKRQYCKTNKNVPWCKYETKKE